MIAIIHLSLAPHGTSFPVLARLGLTLLHTIWEGTLVAALLWVALTILRGRSPQVRYLAGCGAALAMMAGMALTFLLVPASGTVALSPTAERGRNAVAAAAADDELSPAGLSAGSSDLDVSNAARPRLAMGRRPFLAEGRKLLVTWRQQGATLLPFLALVWAAGVLALAVRLIVGCIGVRRLRSYGTSPVEPCWQQRLLALARRMRIDQPVNLRQCAGVTTPAIVGWLRPVILLPVGMCAGLSNAQVEMILAHELAHVGRQDYLVNLLLNVVEAVLFYHPAIWWIAARVREERENACDDLALAAGNDDRLGYARALASLEEMRLPFPAFALAARGDNGTLLTRVRRLLGVPGTRARAFPPRKTACGLAGTVILSGAVAAFLTVAGLTPVRSQEVVGAASTPVSSPESGQTATPAPSPAASTVPMPPTALELAWEEFTKVDAETTRFDQAQKQMKPAASEQEEQKTMAEFLALVDRYHSACAKFVRVAPKEDSRRPNVLLLATGSDIKATPAEHNAVIDEILATPTAPSEVQVRALMLRGNTAATAAKITEFLASHPQEPRRYELERKAAWIRVSDPSSPPASPEFPSSNPTLGADSSSAIKGTGTESPSPSRSAVSSGPTDDKSRRDEISRLGVAAMRGEYEAIEQLAKIAATANEMNADEKASLYDDFRRTFAVFGAEAGRGNATALQTIQQASHLPQLEGFAVQALGQAAGMGNAEALQPLLDPDNHGILLSSAVAALKPAADAGNAQAIAALAATTADPKKHALWFLVADGLASAAGAGNTTAIDTLAALAADKNPNIHRAAMRALEVAADKGQSHAQQALRELIPARPQGADPSSSPATSKPPAVSSPPAAAPSPEPKAAAENPSFSPRTASSGPADEQAAPASTIAETDDKHALLDLFKKRGYSVPDSFIDDRITTIVHDEFGDDRAAFLRDIETKGYTEASFRDAEREEIAVRATRSQMEREAREAKAKAIILPRVQVSGWRLADTIEFLATEVRRLNPAIQGMNVHLDPSATQAFKDAKITLDLSNVSLLDVLQAIARQTGSRFASDRQGVGVAEKPVS